MHLSIRTRRETRRGVWLPLVALVMALSLSWWSGRDHPKPDANDVIPAGDSSLPVLVIDPGHGGDDQGSPISDTLFEKDVALDIALRLGRIVRENGTFEVVYTRDSDIAVPLPDRTTIANQVNADLFLSIHVNKSPVRTVSGPEMYILSLLTSPMTAAENNRAGHSAMETVEQIRRRLQAEKMRKSRLLAERLQPELRKVYESVFGNIPDRAIKEAPFVVLIGTRAPAVVAEVGFASGPEARLLRQGAFRGALAAALYQGIAGGGKESLLNGKK